METKKRYKNLNQEEKILYHRQKAREWREIHDPPLTEDQWNKRLEKTKKRQRQKTQEKRLQIKNNPEEFKKYKIYQKLWHYDISEQELENLNTIKHCEICNHNFELTILQNDKRGPRTPVIDHNHYTNEIRGVLCNACNRLVGRIESLIKNGKLEKIKSWINGDVK